MPNIYSKRDIPPHLQEWFEPAEIGLERTPAEYLEKMTAVFREVRRVLRADGTAWVNMGDGYANHKSGDTYSGFNARWSGTGLDGGKQAQTLPKDKRAYDFSGLKPKDLIGMPWRLAFALQADGWYLRQDIIWAKPNPMPESVTDRCTKSHEYIFLLSKSARYFYDADAIREEHKPESILRAKNPKNGTVGKGKRAIEFQNYASSFKDCHLNSLGRNKRSVWTMNTQPYSGAHFATFPEELPRTCILAGTSPKACPVCGAPWKRDVRAEGGTIGKSWHDHTADEVEGMSQTPGSVGNADNGNGKYRRIDRGLIPGCICDGNDGTGRCVVLDPFLGSGTTAQVAVGLGRDYVGIELNRDYAPLIRQRLGLFYAALTNDI